MSLSVLTVLVSIAIPTLLAIFAAWAYRKWQDRDGRRSPIENRLIHGAGEQLRKRIDDHTDSMHSGLLTLFWLGPYFLAVWALPKIDWARVTFGFGDWLLAVAFAAMVIFAVRHILRHGVRRRRALEGLKAELYTAQELNRLVGDGCIVLHDVPADGFNLDHVVIGPRAVFLVETKSVRKPAKDTPDAHKVSYDGAALRFPHCLSRKPIDQAERQADWLRRYLKASLLADVPVIATVALPGWWVDSTKSSRSRHSVRVFNPAGRGASFMTTEATTTPLSPAQRPLIAQAVMLRFSAIEVK